jgi:hypothetical protein
MIIGHDPNCKVDDEKKDDKDKVKLSLTFKKENTNDVEKF